MKKTFYIIVLLLTVNTINAQVGIGTPMPDPSTILDIVDTERGVLLPRMTNAQRDAIVDPAPGLLFYNVDADQIQINANSAAAPVWEEFSLVPATASAPGDSIKYENTDVTTDINANTAYSNLPIFGTELWNDNTSLYSVTGEELTIAIAGRYNLRTNVSIINPGTNGARQSPELRYFVNGVAVGSYASTGYIRRTGGHQESSLHLDETFDIPADAVVTVRVRRIGSTGPVNLREVGASNILITKIR
ncbi:hypothetical protein [Nonlabens ponticola]|uniref:Uncharacterized protein n=1 Tax=Nonlabens ponticola TaxID=2496866 RepID=A0A3S9MYU4_9FLAO|nr:hypothetical protein [Nonlabens ponticola]AZQ44328.1 hypothetical protein EJ995_08795 [Nonlabens ponticola]